jgi:hypothetical protein
MTLIAGFSINKQPFLIGDLLISGPEQLDLRPSLPTVGDTQLVFPKGSGFTITGLSQKVNVLNDNLMIAWAGRSYIAKSILRDLNTRLAAEPFTIEGIKDYFESFRTSENKNEVQFAGTFLENTKAFSFAIGCEVVADASFGDVCIGGSGTEDAKSFLRNFEPPQLLDGTNPASLLEGISRSLMMTAHFLQLELMSHSSLLQFYGAGYEIASLVDGRLAKIGDMTYLFWHVDATGNSVHLSYPYHVCRYAYRNGVLAIRSARLRFDNSNGILTSDEGVYLVEPAFRQITDEDINAIRTNPPNMNSRFLVNLFLIQFRDGPLQWFNRIDYRPTPTSHIVFEDLPQGLQIAIERRYIERLGAIIRTRIQSTQQVP